MKMLLISLLSILLLTACGRSTDSEPANAALTASDGQGITRNPHPHQRGNAAAGQDVFRFETFGNEGFWIDAMRMPQGMAAAKLTPK